MRAEGPNERPTQLSFLLVLTIASIHMLTGIYYLYIVQTPKLVTWQKVVKW